MKTDDDLVRQLKRRATANGYSLEGEARHILTASLKEGMPTGRKALLEAGGP